MTDETLIDPNAILDIARRLHRTKPITEGEDDGGWVVKGEAFDISTHPELYVGHHTGPETTIIVRMKKGSETIGQREYKIQTRRNEYVRATLYECDRTSGTELHQGSIENAIEAGERLDRGYINGYRVERLDSVLEDIYKWHSQ